MVKIEADIRAIKCDRLYDKAEGSRKKWIEEIIELGGELHTITQGIPRGEFRKWVDENCKRFRGRQADLYIECWSNRHRLKVLPHIRSIRELLGKKIEDKALRISRQSSTEEVRLKHRWAYVAYSTQKGMSNKDIHNEIDLSLSTLVARIEKEELT
jgi:hypothetical protein